MMTRLGWIALLPLTLPSELAVAAEGRIEITDVLSSVSYAKSAPTPGGLTTLFVKGLRGIEGTSVVMQYPAGPELVAGVTVKIYGLPAPVLLVSQLDGYQQINVQVSWKANVTVKPAVEVRQGEDVAMVDTVPEGEFDALYAADDGSALAIKSSDWSRVTADNPIRRGEYFLLFGANMGPVAPPIKDGELAPDLDPPQVVTNGSNYYYANVSVFGPPPERRILNVNVLTTCPQGCYWRLASGLIGVFVMELKLEDSYPGDHTYEVRAGFVKCPVFSFPCRQSVSRTSKPLRLHVNTSSEH
jgi:uncharacterized protein (TIGR03437 family)